MMNFHYIDEKKIIFLTHTDCLDGIFQSIFDQLPIDQLTQNLEHICTPDDNTRIIKKIQEIINKRMLINL